MCRSEDDKCLRLKAALKIGELGHVRHAGGSLADTPLVRQCFSTRVVRGLESPPVSLAGFYSLFCSRGIVN